MNRNLKTRIMQFTKPTVTIDLEEYNFLKSVEEERKTLPDGLTEDELSRVVVALIRGCSNLSETIYNINRNNNIQVTIIEGVEARITFKKLK